jgi:hypothetical protein
MDDNAKTVYYAGLQATALALIFLPEPFTTPIGIALLAYAKNQGQQKTTTVRRVTNLFEDQYTYKFSMVRGTAINYQLAARRSGQLPTAYPKISRLQDNPQYLKAVRHSAKRQYTCAPASKLEPAGLMRGPRLSDRAALAVPKNFGDPRMRSVIT